MKIFVSLSEPLGYRFGKYNKKGIVFYKFDEPIDTIKDTIAFGFMTWYENGTIFRADSADNGDFIRIFLVCFIFKVNFLSLFNLNSIINVRKTDT